MKSATLFALGLLSVGVWLLGSARGQSLAPPISLAPPSTEQGAAAKSAWPLRAAPKASPPRATAKNSRPPAKRNGEPSSATSDALPSGASAKVSSTPVISRPRPSAQPAIDYDGFSVGTVDDSDTSGQAVRPTRSRAAKASKPNVETSGVTRQESIDQGDEALKHKLTICRGCK
ncbi:hypothetical protein FXB38_23940 [Bradyrhizobium cytisi]|uniref:Uncharacterized protein n=1 Tax=Bradyrhizobium cytisi TaxID=515489 RepID=A0A5S4WGQ7_9BRAD|nr:hypothetical protein [Bradyrhizobium cytisi]TYL80763.1 hypothetical protein FXB38_23940 [Bradyrhizobium cytisi]